MTSILAKLNLRPQEQRLVVIVGIVVFIVLNFLLVFPHFGEWSKNQQRANDAEKTLNKYKEEMKKEDQYKKELERLQKMGGYVPSDQMALDLMGEVRTQAAATGLNVQRWDPKPPAPRATNSFFDESALLITFVSNETNLINFMWNLSSQGSLTRVKTMSLRRDPSQMNLMGDMTLVKSFQRKPAAAPPKPSALPAGLKAVTKPGAATNAPAKPAAGPPARALAAKGPQTSAPAKPGAAPLKAAAKSGSPTTNKTAHATQTKNSSTNSPGFLKRILSKWF